MLEALIAVPIILKEVQDWAVAIAAVLTLLGLLHQFFLKPLTKTLIKQITDKVEESYDNLNKKVEEAADMNVRFRLELSTYLQQVHERLIALENANGIHYPFRLGGTKPPGWDDPDQAQGSPRHRVAPHGWPGQPRH